MGTFLWMLMMMHSMKYGIKLFCCCDLIHKQNKYHKYNWNLITICPSDAQAEITYAEIHNHICALFFSSLPLSGLHFCCTCMLICVRACWLACRLIIFSYICHCLYVRHKAVWHVHERASVQHVDTSTESTVQQIFCRSAARAAGGLSVGPIYEIGLSVTTLSD